MKKNNSTLSTELNLLSKKITNLSFNKAVNKFKKFSPFLKNNVIYFPFFYEDEKVFITLNHNSVTIPTFESESEFSINFSKYTTLNTETIQFSHIEKSRSGWNFYFSGTNDSFYISMSHSDDGLFVDFWCMEDLGDNEFSPICLESTYAYFNEIIEENEDC